MKLGFFLDRKRPLTIFELFTQTTCSQYIYRQGYLRYMQTPTWQRLKTPAEARDIEHHASVFKNAPPPYLLLLYEYRAQLANLFNCL